MTDHPQTYGLAWSMFQRRCNLDGADPAMVELAWLDEDVRAFWLAEADAVLGHLEEKQEA